MAVRAVKTEAKKRKEGIVSIEASASNNTEMGRCFAPWLLVARKTGGILRSATV